MPCPLSERASTPVQFDREVNVEMLMPKQNRLSSCKDMYILKQASPWGDLDGDGDKVSATSCTEAISGGRCRAAYARRLAICVFCDGSCVTTSIT